MTSSHAGELSIMADSSDPLSTASPSTLDWKRDSEDGVNSITSLLGVFRASSSASISNTSRLEEYSFEL